MDAACVGADDDNGQQPPRGQSRLDKEPGGDEAPCNCRGDGPVVAEDVALPERKERPNPAEQRCHRAAPSGAVGPADTVPTSLRQPDASRTRTKAAATYNAPSHASASSLPGHATPRLSPAQNVPKVTSIAPTKSCKARRGIWATRR